MLALAFYWNTRNVYFKFVSKRLFYIIVIKLNEFLLDWNFPGVHIKVVLRLLKYPYILEYSLRKSFACKDNTSVISAYTRLSLDIKTPEGLIAFSIKRVFWNFRFIKHLFNVYLKFFQYIYVFLAKGKVEVHIILLSLVLLIQYNKST